jgi:hypothetical protein
VTTPGMSYLEWPRLWGVLCSESAVLRSAAAPKTYFGAPFVEMDVVKIQVDCVWTDPCLA